jgi:hypothetical protein
MQTRRSHVSGLEKEKSDLGSANATPGTIIPPDDVLPLVKREAGFVEAAAVALVDDLVA